MGEAAAVVGISVGGCGWGFGWAWGGGNHASGFHALGFVLSHPDSRTHAQTTTADAADDRSVGDIFFGMATPLRGGSPAIGAPHHLSERLTGQRQPKRQGG
jgi:hypothetical protein